MKTAATLLALCLFLVSSSLPAQDGREHSIRACAPARHYMRHADSRGSTREIRVEPDSRDARFKTVRGLAGSDCVSFQSMEWGLRRVGDEGSFTFRSDASLFIEPVRRAPQLIDYDAGQPASD